MKKLLSILIAVSVAMTMSVTAFAGTISEDGAIKVALKDAGLAKTQIKAFKSEYDKASKSYEVEFIGKKNKNEYEYEIAETDGKILEKSIDYNVKKIKSKKKIGKASAYKKAAKASGVSLKVVKKGSCKYKYGKKQGKYTVKFKNNGYQYECEVQAPTGKIMEMEYEFIK